MRLNSGLATLTYLGSIIMSIVPVLAIFLFVLFFSKEATASAPPQPHPKTEGELLAELLTTLLDQKEKQ